MSTIRLQILRQQLANQQAKVETARQTMQNAARDWSAWRVANPLKPVVASPDVACDALAEPDNQVTTDVEWKSTPPPEPGVYIASRYRAQNIRMYWDGCNWSLGWLIDSSAGEIATRRALIQHDNTGIMWLRRDDTVDDTTTCVWTSTIPPAPGKYIASSCRHDGTVRFWSGRAWSDFWRMPATDEEIAVRMKEFPLGLGPAGIQWLRSV